MSYVVSPRADEDIFEVWRNLHERAGVEVANRVESEFYAFRRARTKSPDRAQAFRSHSLSRALLYSLFIHDRVQAP